MEITQTIHRIGVAVGAVVVSIGLVLLFVPGVARSVPVTLIVSDIAAVGAILLAGFAVRNRYYSEPNRAFVPDVEYPLATDTPGHEIDDLIYRVTELKEGSIEYREEIRDRIADIAMGVIMQREECSREQARAQLLDGTWTEREAAASFFAGGGSSPSLVDSLVQRFTGARSDYERQLDETIAAIEEIARALETDAGEVVVDREDDGGTQAGMAQRGVLDDGESRRVSETTRYRSLIETHHWAGVSAVGLSALAVGTIATQPGVLLFGAVGLGAAVYATVFSAPDLTALEVTRSLSEDTPEPGEEVDVTVTVENAGDTYVPDLRLVDRVPPTMRVVDGSTRRGTALRPGQSVTLEYTIEAEHGEHEWPLQVLGRDPSAATEREALIETDAVLECVPRLRTATEAPTRLQTSVYSGGVETRVGGEGLEFHSLRDYLPGDPMRRIDWKTFARSGEFATVDYRQERAAKIVLLFDTRESSYVSPAPGEKHAVDRSLDAAFDIFASLYDQGHLLGIAAYDTVSCWIGPSRGSSHLEEVRQAVLEHPALSSLPPTLMDKDGYYVDPMTHIRRQLPQNTQIYLFSPLTDSYTYEVARQLNGAGHLVTVISPDPTAARTVGQRLARLERDLFINKLREHRIPVVDWQPDQSLRLALESVRRRWSV